MTDTDILTIFLSQIPLIRFIIYGNILQKPLMSSGRGKLITIQNFLNFLLNTYSSSSSLDSRRKAQTKRSFQTPRSSIAVLISFSSSPVSRFSVSIKVSFLDLTCPVGDHKSRSEMISSLARKQ